MVGVVVFGLDSELAELVALPLGEGGGAKHSPPGDLSWIIWGLNKCS